jgi:chromosome segregation ATPase
LQRYRQKIDWIGCLFDVVPRTSSFDLIIPMSEANQRKDESVDDQIDAEFQALKQRSKERCEQMDARISTLEAHILAGLSGGANRLEEQYKAILEVAGGGDGDIAGLPHVDALKHEIQRIRNRKTKFELDMKVQRNTKHYQMNDSKSLMNQLKDVRTQRISAQFKVEKQETEIRTLKEALRGANEKAETIASRAAEKEEKRVFRLRKQLKEALDRISSLETSLGELSDVTDENMLLKAQVQELQGVALSSAQNAMGPERSLAQSGATLDATMHLRSKSNLLELERNKARSESQRTNALLIEKMSQITTLETSRQMLKEDLKSTKSSLFGAEEKYKDYTSHLREKILNLEGEAKGLRSAHREKDELIATFELKEMTFETELTIAKNAVASATEGLERSQADAAKKNKTFATKCQTLKDALDEKGAALKQSHALIASMQEQMEIISESLEEAQTKTKATNKAFLSLQDDARTKLKDSEIRIKTLQLDLEDLRSKLKSAHENVAKRDETVNALEWKLDMSRSEYDELKEKSSLAQTQWDMTERSANKETRVLKEQLDATMKKESFLTKQLATSENTVGMLNEISEKARVEKEQMESFIAELQKNREETVGNLMAENGKLEWSLSLQKEAFQKSEKANEGQQAEIEALKKNVEKWEASCTQILDEKDVLLRQGLQKESELNGRLVQLRDALREKKSAEETLTKTLVAKEVKITTLETDLGSLRKSITEANKRNQQKEQAQDELKVTLQQKIVDLNMKLEKTNGELSESTFAREVLTEKNGALETKLTLARAELETLKRKNMVQSNASAESMEMMRESNRKMERNLEHERERTLETSMEASKYKGELNKYVEELQAAKEDRKSAKQSYANKHNVDARTISELKLKIEETTSIVKMKETIIEKMRAEFSSQEQKVFELGKKESELYKQKEEEIQEAVHEEKKRYFKLLDRLKTVQRELSTAVMKRDELQEALSRGNNHPAHLATEISREADRKMQDASAMKSNTTKRDAAFSDLMELYQQVIRYTKDGKHDLGVLSGEAYSGIARIGGYKGSWLMGIRNMERTLQIWREVEEKAREYESLLLAAGFYCHAYVQNRNPNLLDRAIDKCRALVVAANFSGNPVWKEELGTYNKFIHDVEQVKAGNKKVSYGEETTGHMQYLTFSLL